MELLTGYIYKPNRVLYYIEPTMEEKKAYLEGIIPDALLQYDDAFGTYDCPSLFVLTDSNCGESKEVIGIEFRPNDSRITYPRSLSSVELEPGFVVTALLPDTDLMSVELAREGIGQAVNQISPFSFHNHYLTPQKNPSYIQICTLHGTNKVIFNANKMTEGEFFDEKKAVTENEKKLFDEAYRDVVTGHYNWNYLWPIIAGYGLKGIQDFVFVHFDVKDFNALNIIYGHEVANSVLRRIVDHMNRQDWIYYSARCDNDNFAMMVKDMPEKELRELLLNFFEELIHLEQDHNYHIYFRCGVVPMRNTLLLGNRVADAGKQVQRQGTNKNETEVLFYTDAMHDNQEFGTRLKAYLDTAIANDEFLVYLQPKYDVETETLHGAEALVRWKYRGREMLPPGKFIPVFETSGMIGKLDDIVLKKVCSYFVKWKQQGLPLLPISVNLSRKSMGNPHLTSQLIEIVDSYGVDHSLIDFELTESASYDNQRQMLGVLSTLKASGFRISMDDFGTGYSSLSLLAEMPMDTLKIDKSFVDGLADSCENKKDGIIIKHIISMAKDLKFTCLAEGAEDKSQVDALREYGCEIVQGYYYSKPLPVEDYEKLLG